MKKLKPKIKIKCSCGVPVSAGMQRFHETSAWHINQELIRRGLEADLSLAEIGRLISRDASYVSYYLKLCRNGK